MLHVLDEMRLLTSLRKATHLIGPTLNLEMIKDDLNQVQSDQILS